MTKFFVVFFVTLAILATTCKSQEDPLIRLFDDGLARPNTGGGRNRVLRTLIKSLGLINSPLGNNDESDGNARLIIDRRPRSNGRPEVNGVTYEAGEPLGFGLGFSPLLVYGRDYDTDAILRSERRFDDDHDKRFNRGVFNNYYDGSKRRNLNEY